MSRIGSAMGPCSCLTRNCVLVHKCTVTQRLPGLKTLFNKVFFNFQEKLRCHKIATQRLTL